MLLVQPQPLRLRLRREAEPRSQVVQDQRGLRDDQRAGAQERRRKHLVALHLQHHRLHAPRPARDIDVIGARVLEREADEFAPPLDARPVVELVFHSTAGLSGSSLGFTAPAGKWRARMPVTDPMAASAPSS